MSKDFDPDEWTFVNKFMADLLDQIPGNETMWYFRFENNETGQRVLVMGEDEDEAWGKLADGTYNEE